MKIYIKNMVCDRCIAAVKYQMDDLGIGYRRVQLGEVELSAMPDAGKMESLRAKLEEQGFELLDDKKSRLVEKIKTSIISLVHRNEEKVHNKKLSALLEDELQMDYHYLSTLFSSVEGITIEKYAILQRIERVKELLKYDEKSLSEIAFEMGYSSVQHLSQQFKKITGLTPTSFKHSGLNLRRPLDKI